MGLVETGDSARAAQGRKVPVTPKKPPVEQVQRYLTGVILF